jgi:polar amino acid transport system substrate-binding protein
MRHVCSVLAGAALLASCLAPPRADASTLASVQERGWIRVCAHPDALPFSSQEPSQPGIQLEIGEAIAKILKVRLVHEWIVYTRTARRADCDAIIGGVIPLKGETKPPPRTVLLSKPYAGGGYVLAVARADTTVHRAADVKSGKVGVEYTSWPHYLLQTQGISTSAFGSQTDIIDSIVKGEIVAGIVTEPYLGWYLKGHPGGAVKIADGYVRDPELQWNVAVRLVNTDEAMRNAVNQALDTLLADGTIPAIFAKYGVNYLPPHKP